MEKENIKNLTPPQIAERVALLGEPPHRKTQILQWLYQKGADSFSAMTNLPLELRNTLEGIYRIPSLRVRGSLTSKVDRSQKFLLESDGGLLIESVLMEARGNFTLCVSSQAGCPLGCSFCKTGRTGKERDLRCDEIVNQVLFARMNHVPPRRRLNIVFMGMGEPLLNLENVCPAIELLNEMDAFALGEKRITLSTIGFVEKILFLARSPLKFGLAVSLNATTNRVRKKIMPAAEDLSRTLDAAEKFALSRGTRSTLEYVLLRGVNDTPRDALRLAELTHGRPFKINLIPFNEWEGSGFKRPEEKRIEKFIGLLLPRSPAVTVRRSQGSDIDGACGQLKARYLNQN
ncbi:MAG: 23S rRNA (adenine(2503)-C(2))-methyltransferase RlmN [Candidatus Krumholzibacteriota bacterium]|nr:23S rRNA (adenine(2503)-C(2))-methyltransferase RlmN [Candidatus Krumholzibacteriota bacterium]